MSNGPDFAQIAHEILSKSLQGRPTWGERIGDMADALAEAYAAGQRAMQERAAGVCESLSWAAQEKIRALEVEHA